MGANENGIDIQETLFQLPDSPLNTMYRIAGKCGEDLNLVIWQVV